MATRHIQTTGEQSACDVCGRTLLRGERAQVYVAGASRRSVCELCTTRALHEGWVREGAAPAVRQSQEGRDGRRSLLGRLRARREEPDAPAAQAGAGRPDRPRRAPREAARAERPLPAPAREPRHVRAVPTSAEHRVASAVELFNGSEHCRTIAGVARSLGVPAVSVRASAGHASVVEIVVSWELCWYRYEVDLADEASVRVTGQGYELEELAPHEREPNAAADERGAIALR
jgi:hypothetical protein